MCNEWDKRKRGGTVRKNKSLQVRDKVTVVYMEKARNREKKKVIQAITDKLKYKLKYKFVYYNEHKNKQ